MRRRKRHGFSHRCTAMLLCVCMITTMIGGIGVLRAYADGNAGDTRSGTSGATQGVTRQADPSTMDTYQQMLNFKENTRYAGRLWSDKTVFALDDKTNSKDKDWNGTTLTLNKKDDGVTDTTIKLDEDFLHVYSALGSSQEVVGVPPVRAVIVFDNSGSMYNSNSTGAVTKDGTTSYAEDGEELWKLQRIGMTIEAINRAIDTLMEASEYNEVSVVMFGDGENKGTYNNASDVVNDTMRYHGQSTAVTILPMKHYEPLSANDENRQGVDKENGDEGYTPYLTGGWNKDNKTTTDENTTLNGAKPSHTGNDPSQDEQTKGIKGKAIGGGWVYVNNDICKLNKDDIDTNSDNPGHKWYKTEKDGSWNGWNGCVNNKYTAYSNGTTDIQAGYYVGMQELLKASKTEQVGNQTYQCVPSLVMLTDGQTTDMLTGNFVTPTFSKEDDPTSEPTARGFVNDTGNKLRSFTGATGSNAKEIGNFWDMFVEMKDGKYQTAGWENAKKDDTGKYVQGPPEGAGLEAMKDVARNYSDSIASMVLGTLMTTAYYKEGVKREYKADDGWDIYTISVDMKDPQIIPEDAAQKAINDSSNDVEPKTELPARWEYDITSNPAAMDPAKYFYTYDVKNGEWKLDLGWLVDKGYIDKDKMSKETLASELASGKDIDVTGKTAYPDWSVGEMLIQGIVTAACKLKQWETGQPIELKYQPWNSKSGILECRTKKNPADPSKTVPDTDTAGNRQPKDANEWVDGRYVNPWTHNDGYFLEEEQQVQYQILDGTKDDANPYGLTAADVMNNIAYNDYAYYPSTANGSAQDLAGAFVKIIDSITEHLFVPVEGDNDLGVSSAVTFKDPMGKYMDVKDVKGMTLFGKYYGIVKTAVYDYQWNDLYMTYYNGGDDHGKTPMTAGWYKGDPSEETQNGNVQYSEDLPNGLTSEQAWDAGWVYRVGYDIAGKFVPTLKDIYTEEETPDEMTTKAKETKYTFYRLDTEDGKTLTSDDREALHVNPAYIEAGKEEKDYLDGVEYDPSGAGGHMENNPGVYALADLRIWVEDTGDFSDSDTGGTLTDTNYDEALWVNIPSNMLPLRTVTVNLGKTIDGSDNKWAYTNNLVESDPAYKASFPLRVFYTVGLSNDVLENSRVNIAGAISTEYVLQNKINTAEASTARNIEQGNLEFFSNWYNPLNRYGDYATTNTDYTYGDPVTTFSPSTDNRYYIFEKALPLYNTAYIWVDKDKQWRQIQIGEDLTGSQDVRTFDANSFGGNLLAQDLDVGDNLPTSAQDATDKISTALGGVTPEDGDIVLLKGNRLANVDKPEGDGTDPFAPDKYYYMPIEYYQLDKEGTAEYTHYVVTRKGGEFGSAYSAAGITNGDMLVWHDMNGKYPDYPYLSYTETSSVNNADPTRGRQFIGWELGADGYYKGCDKAAHETPDISTYVGGQDGWEKQHTDVMDEGEWVVCAKPGGLRVGGLAQSVQSKGGTFSDDAAIGEYYTNERYKESAEANGLTWGFYGNNVTRTANNYYVPTISTTSNAEKKDIIVNTYLGNNGRLYVADTTLLVTKTVELDDDASPNPDEEFNFQVFVNSNDITGAQTALVVQYNETAQSWQRQFHYIDLELDSQLFLQTQDGNKAMVDKEGCRVIAQGDGYVYAEDCKSSTGASHSAGDPYDGTVYYVYIGHNRKSGDDINAPVTGFRVYHNNDVDSHGTVSTEDVTTKGTSGKTGTFCAATVWLVSESKYNTDWVGNGLDPSGAGFNIEDHNNGTLSNFELLTIDPNISDTSEHSISTPYRTVSAYWTKNVTFGRNANADGGKTEVNQPLTADDLYDGIIPSTDRSDYFAGLNNETIAEHTAEFTLRHGQALLFSGIPSNTVYRVTEKLTEAQMKAGYTLKKVSHTQQVGSTSTYRPGAQSIPVYYNAGTTYGWYGGGAYPSQYNNHKTEKGLMWALDQDGNSNESQYRHYEPFHHTNAVVWDAYSTMYVNAKGDNHHQPTSVPDGESTFWLWDESSQTSTNAGSHTVQDNPSCKPLEQGGCDDDLENGQVRHYFFKDGVLRDVHYKGEGSGYIRNIGRYITSPTVHFGVKGEKQTDAATDMTEMKSNTDYTGVYSVFGNTGTYEESANFVNTINRDKTETQINDEKVESSEEDPNLYPGVQTGDEVTYQIKWSNATGDKARVVIIDPLDKGVDFVSAPAGKDTTGKDTPAGTFYDTKEAANAALKEIYKDSDPANIPKLDYGHVVIWDLGEQDSGNSGEVTLTVKVNENATEWWDYDGDGVADAPKDPMDPDHMIRNRATVRVADNAYTTNTVVNPVGKPSKTETQIDHADGTEEYNVTVPGHEDNVFTLEKDTLDPNVENKWDGPVVFTGDKITYEITWHNYKEVPATVSIRDPLDKNVEFVSAAYDPADFVDADDKTFDPPLNPADRQSITGDGGKDVASGVKVGGYGKDGKTELDTIAYTSEDHTVTYNLGTMPAGASGKVTLVVRVLDSAKPVGYVDNTAYVAVNGDPEQRTETIENPIPNPEKTEVTPGDGVLVGIGDEITYQIDWQNYKDKPARVVIMDTLDQGVDFASAENGGTYYEEGGKLPESDDYEAVTIPAHTVVWVLEDQPAGASGSVTLTVTVNEKAKVKNTYNDTADGFETSENEKDYEVLDQARVKVDNDTFVKTEIVENPVPEKTETQIERGSGGTDQVELKLKEGEKNTYIGPEVFVGDVITYKIHWKNSHDEPRDVTITDDLDPGVDFVSADNGGVYDKGGHSVIWTLENRAANTEGDVTLEVKVTERAVPAQKVDNQAAVQVGDDAAVKTEIIENPTPLVEKIETTPGEGMQVMPGDEIDYEITWRNYEEEPADVVIIDKLDPGVDFVSAGFSGGTTALTKGENIQKPTEANLLISLTGDAADTAFNFTLDLTAPEGGNLASRYEWTKTGAGGTMDTGTWTQDDKTITLKPGESLTVIGLPVGARYTLTSENGTAVVADQALGIYGSAVTVAVAKEAQTIRSQEALDGGVTIPDNGEGTPNEPATGEDDQETPDNGEGAPNAPAADESENNGQDIVESYAFSATVLDLPEPVAAPEPEAEDTPAPIALVSGFDKEAGTLDGVTATMKADITLQDGKEVTAYYFAKAHTVVWVLKDREPGAEGFVNLKVRVNADAEKLWSYDHPEWGPSGNQNDDRVRNQAGVQVGNNPEVKTRIIENPTNPVKTETEINGEDVSKDLIADENGYVGPDVNVGDRITYQILWQNNAADAETGVPVNAEITITDALDPGVDFVSADNGGTYDPQTHTVTWTLGEQEARANGTVTLTVRVNKSAVEPGQVENTATVTVGDRPQQTDKVTNKVNTGGALTVSKTVTGNLGNKTREFHFTVTLDDKTINGRYGDMVFENGVAQFTLSDGESRTATGLPEGTGYEVTEAEADQDGYHTAAEGEKGKIPMNDTAVAEFTNDRNMEPHKTEVTPGDGKTVQPGDEITYEITWQNPEAEKVTIIIRDPLDPGVDFVSADNGGVYDATTHTVTWTFEAEAGAEGKVGLTVRVNGNALTAGVVQNQAFVKVGDYPEIATEIPKNPVEPETPPSGGTPSGTPQTGDNSRLGIWTILFVSSLASVIVCVVSLLRSRRRRLRAAAARRRRSGTMNRRR